MAPKPLLSITAALVLLGLASCERVSPSRPPAPSDSKPSCCSAETPAVSQQRRAPPGTRGRRPRATTARYEVPDVQLLDQNGRRVRLRHLLGGPDPVALNFVFTTCTTICPVMTATFSRLQEELGADGAALRLVSISLDPEYDTPKVLARYAKLQGAGPRWTFLTGSSQQVERTYRAFGALTGSKFSHKPFTLLKMPGADHWVRVEGLTRVDDLAREYRRLVAQGAGKEIDE